MTKQDPKSPSAAGIGPTAQAREPSVQAGTRPLSANSSVALAKSSPVAAAMAAADPNATMGKLADCMPASLQASLRAKTVIRYPGEREVVTEFLGWELTAPVPSQELSQALASAKMTMQGLSSTEILPLLVVLKAKTIARNENTEDTEFAVRIYAEDLSKWPADIVRKVVSEWPSRCKFWPAWAELEERLQRIVARRRALVGFLQAQLEAAAI